MAKVNYAKIRAKVGKALVKIGGPGTIIKKGSTGGRDAFNKPIPDEPDTIINGTITPILFYSAKEIDGTNIKMGDGSVLFHSEIPPEIGMQTTINGITYNIISFPAGFESLDGVRVFIKLQLRI